MLFINSILFYAMRGFMGLCMINYLLSFFPKIYNYGFFRVLKRFTDSYLGMFEGIFTLGSIDFSPLVGTASIWLLSEAYSFLVVSAWL